MAHALHDNNNNKKREEFASSSDDPAHLFVTCLSSTRGLQCQCTTQYVISLEADQTIE